MSLSEGLSVKRSWSCFFSLSLPLFPLSFLPFRSLSVHVTFRRAFIVLTVFLCHAQQCMQNACDKKRQNIRTTADACSRRPDIVLLHISRSIGIGFFKTSSVSVIIFQLNISIKV